jgi:putative ABC transport system permease protein
VNLPPVNYGDTSSAVAAFHGRVLEVLGREPGVTAAGFVNVLPLEGNNPNGAMEVEGKPHDPRGPFNGQAVYRVVGGEYFRAMGIALVAGRMFGPGDDRRAAPVTVVSETFARTEWPNESALGKRVRPAGMDAGQEPWYVVVGVVEDVRGASMIDAYREVYYFDHRQRPPYRTRSVTYVARAAVDPASLGGAVQRLIAAVDPQVPVETRSLRRLVLDSVADRRFTVVLLGAFAAVALFLTIVGIYAVVSYAVARRTREIGVRLALGGTPAGMRRMVLLAAMRAIAPGLGVGVLLALGGSGVLRSLLYGISPFDAGTLATAVVVLGVAALASSLVPARRATRVDPMLAIRSE